MLYCMSFYIHKSLKHTKFHFSIHFCCFDFQLAFPFGLLWIEEFTTIKWEVMMIMFFFSLRSDAMPRALELCTIRFGYIFSLSINCVLENVSYKIECESRIATRTVVIHKTPSAENQNNATSVYWKHVIILIHMRIIHKTHLPLFFNSQRHSVVVAAAAVFSIWMKSENRTIFTNWMWILKKRETEREGRQQHSQRFELVWNSIWFLSSKRLNTVSMCK